MDRYWLLTWTTYGTWLPGDERGFVGRGRVADGRQLPQNIPGTPARSGTPKLERLARQRMAGRAIWLTPEHAPILLRDFQRTAEVRRWELVAAAVMRNHVHLVVGVPGDPDPAGLLRDFKSYGSKAVSGATERPERGRWWTQSGSRRVLRTEANLIAAIRYALTQYEPLATWREPGIDPAWLREDA